eukprot:4037094-Lingulodinium_polyedra.AAC.1
MARVGLGDLPRTVGTPDALARSFFADVDDHLAGVVERSWNRWADAGGGRPRSRVAAGVWSALRN